MSRDKLSTKQFADLIMQINGEIEPIGETNTDSNRYDNLIRLQNVVDLLLEEISTVCIYCNRPEYSMSKSGTRALSWVTSTKEWLDEIISMYREKADE